MKHVIITGGAGLVGSHLCERFIAAGYAVTALDNFLTSRKENIEHLLTDEYKDRFDFFKWDINFPFDEEKLKFVKEHGVAGVLHFACPASPVDFHTVPFEILRVDSIGTMNTVDLAIRHDARYILASTSEIYGDPLEHPQKETYFGNVNTIGPRACYDEAKRFGEAYVSTAARAAEFQQSPFAKGLDAGIVRIFNTYGPRNRPDDGRVVPNFCMQALKGDPITIHGEGNQTRSFCFVTDLVEGIFRLFESSEKNPVNIGNPKERTILEFAKTVIELTGGKSDLVHLPSRPDDPRKRCPDITRAKSILNWEPKVDLKEGLSKTLEFFKNFV